MRYFKIADTFKFATEKMGREELKRTKEIPITIKPWICCFSKRSNACVLALFCLLLNIIGFVYLSNHCDLTFLCILVQNMDWYWFGIELIYCTSNFESILVMLDNFCVKLEAPTFSWILKNLNLELNKTFYELRNKYWQLQWLSCEL